MSMPITYKTPSLNQSRNLCRPGQIMSLIGLLIGSVNAGAEPTFIEIANQSPDPILGDPGIPFGVSINSSGQVSYAFSSIPVGGTFFSTTLFRHDGIRGGQRELLYYSSNPNDFSCFVPVTGNPPEEFVPAHQKLCSGISGAMINDDGDVAFSTGSKVVGTGSLGPTDIVIGDGSAAPVIAMQWADKLNGGFYDFWQNPGTWRFNNDDYVAAFMFGKCSSASVTWDLGAYILGHPSFLSSPVLGGPGASPPGIELFNNCAGDQTMATGPGSAIAITPDGTRVVFAGNRDMAGEEGLFVIDTESGPPLPLTFIANIALSGAGVQVAINNQGEVAYLHSTSTTLELRVTDSNNPDPSGVHELILSTPNLGGMTLLGLNNSGQIAISGDAGSGAGIYLIDRGPGAPRITPLLLNGDPYPPDPGLDVIFFNEFPQSLNDAGEIVVVAVLDFAPSDRRVLKI